MPELMDKHKVAMRLAGRWIRAQERADAIKAEYDAALAALAAAQDPGQEQGEGEHGE